MNDKNKKTTVKVTKSTQLLENEILKHMDIPKATFHRRAIDYFIGQGGEIHPHLLIKERKDPHYVCKNAVEQVYLDEERKAALEKVADKYGCGYTIVLFNALMTYCSVMAPIILGDDTVEHLVKK